MKMFLLLLAMLTSFVGYSAQSQVVHLQDHPVPWPWGLEQPFPWNEIQGTWKMADAGSGFYFSFRVVRQRDGISRLVVNQIDAVECRVVATGVGYEINKVLRAQMRNEDGSTYRLSLRAFKEEDSPQPVIGTVTSQVMVLSMSKLDSPGSSQNLHIQIGKTSPKSDLKGCNSEKIGK